MIKSLDIIYSSRSEVITKHDYTPSDFRSLRPSVSRVLDTLKTRLIRSITLRFEYPMISLIFVSISLDMAEAGPRIPRKSLLFIIVIVGIFMQGIISNRLTMSK